jgi:putative tricarboxylic transport membrane protein
MLRISSDLASGLFWLALSVFICIKSAEVGIGSIRSPGSGFLPFWAGVLFGMLAMVLVLKSLIKKRINERSPIIGNVKWNRALVVLGSLYAYAILLQKIGYLLATFGLMIILFCVLDRPKWWVGIVSSLLTVTLTYMIFYKWLGVQLPKGVLTF